MRFVFQFCMEQFRFKNGTGCWQDKSHPIELIFDRHTL